MYHTTNVPPSLWTVPQLLIMTIYNSPWSIIIQWIRDILADDNLTDYIQNNVYFLFLINTPYHMNNGFQQMWAEIKHLWNYTSRRERHIVTSYNNGSMNRLPMLEYFHTSTVSSFQNMACD